MAAADLPSRVLDLAYSAPLEPERWPALLKEIVRTVAADAGLVLADAPDGSGLAVVASTGLDPGPVAAYQDRGIHHDVMARASLDRPVGTLIRDSDVMPHARFLRTELAAILLAPHGLGHVLGTALRLGPPDYAAIWLYRGLEMGRFEHDAVARLEAVVGHLCRALEIHHRLDAAQRQVAAANAILDRLAVAAVMVDELGRPVGSNRMAERIALAGDGLAVRPEGLAAATPTATTQLRSQICTALRLSSQSPPKGRGLRVERPSGGRPYELIVMPLAGRHPTGTAPHVAGVVFVIDPDAAPPASQRMVEELYGLTPAEARLSLHLLHGIDLTEAAAALGVSRNTAQSQLAAIFRKTGTHRQAELVQLLTRGPGAVRPLDDSSGFWPRADPLG